MMKVKTWSEFQVSGRRIACQLVIHGANLEYQDIALRNTLFWAVYNNNRCTELVITVQYRCTTTTGTWLSSSFVAGPGCGPGAGSSPLTFPSL